MMRRTLLAVAFLSLSSVCVTHAHPLAPAVLAVAVNADGTGEVTWKVPAGTRLPPLEPVLPSGCVQTGASAIERPGGAFVRRIPVRCASLDGQRIAVVGLAGTSSQVFVRVQRAGGSVVTDWLRAASPEFTIPPAQTASDELYRFLCLGVRHLVEGLDHQLFLIGLVFLIGWRRRLFVAVSAFTVGHSMTLVAGFLGWIAVGEAWVEVGIALTIVALAAHLGTSARNPSLLERRPALMAGSFGLFHGLGFASVLETVGMPPDHWMLALFSFNAGIELAQLVGILAAFCATRMLATVHPDGFDLRQQGVQTFASYALGSTAAYWTVERTLEAVFR